ncbi:P-loop containing nucleoside triphosphate hydrolase [Forsythia ovata]|uniref:P-loop containing nucleoside triphosphate hydrolase n=1 Tax=Forsythia ovata TaxID=205694 RepID=A0ABD1SNF3_9LAMI
MKLRELSISLQATNARMLMLRPGNWTSRLSVTKTWAVAWWWRCGSWVGLLRGSGGVEVGLLRSGGGGVFQIIYFRLRSGGSNNLEEVIYTQKLEKMILDEPTSGLDSTTAFQLVETLTALAVEKRKTVPSSQF